jgi:hypothetical protein
LGDVSLFYSCCEFHWALDAFKNIMMKIGPNAPALDGLCIWMMQISSRAEILNPVKVLLCSKFLILSRYFSKPVVFYS